MPLRDKTVTAAVSMADLARERGVPPVFFGCTPESELVSVVLKDREGGRQATQHRLAQGGGRG